MNEHLASPSPLDLGPASGPTPDGGPPPLPGPAPTGLATNPGATPQLPNGHSPLEDDPTGTRPSGGRPAGGRGRQQRAFQMLRRSPVRRDRDQGLLGGVCAGIARSTGLPVIVVRAIAVALALLPGTVVGAYLVVWALLPDQDGGIHAERAVQDGRPRSLVILGLGGLALVGMLSWAFNTWPLLIAAGIVALVLLKNKPGHSCPSQRPVG